MTAFTDEMSTLPRSHRPYRLYTAWAITGEVDDHEMRRLLLDVWQDAEWPAYLGHRPWLEMFAAAGYVDDRDLSQTNPQPGASTLYRGAAITKMRGFSWTWDIDRARWFAERTVLFGFPASVYAIDDLPNEMLLGVLHGGRGESEAIVNPRRLRGRWSPRDLGLAGVGRG